MSSNLNINDVFRSKDAMIAFGKMIEPIVNDKTAQRSINELHKKFVKLIPKRLRPQTITMIFQIMDDENDQNFKTGSNVLIAILKWATATGEKTKQFLRTFVESYWQMPENISSHFSKYYAILVEQLHGIESPVPIPLTGMLEFYRLAFGQGDKEARALVENLHLICVENFSLLFPSNELKQGKTSDGGFTMKAWLCPDQNLAAAILQDLMENMDRQKNQSDETKKVFDLITAKATVIENFLVACWDDITNNPRRDVLPDGGDLIQVSGYLRLTGTLRIQFIREGFLFPQVGVRNYYRAPNGRERTYITALEPGYGSTTSDALHLYRLPEFVFETFCYHQIVCAPPRPAGNGTGRVKPIVVTSDREQAAIKVRAHFRRLVEGYQPSPEQVQKALHAFGRLPEGYTYVIPHERNPFVPDQKTTNSPSPSAVVDFDDVLKIVIGS